MEQTDTKKGIKHLRSLIQLDIDAVRAYTQAIEKIDAPIIRQQLERFRGDHERHITDLSTVMRELGGTPPERKPDLKGMLIEGFTTLRSVTGTEGALKAMRGNEMLTNATYERALKDEDLPESSRSVVLRNREDERRHLQYIEEVLKSKVWESDQTRRAG